MVWRARDTLLERDVAVKEIEFPSLLGEAERASLREKVLREARAAARLSHSGTVTVFDVVEDDGRPLVVMELVDSPTLAQVVARDGPLDPARAAAIGLEVLDTLQAAHAQGMGTTATHLRRLQGRLRGALTGSGLSGARFSERWCEPAGGT